MTYSIKEIFYTLQGEGYHTGRPAVFVRFSGCNLWTGREADRDKAICQFCDTQFVGTDGQNGGRFTATELVDKIKSLWPDSTQPPFIVCTGGEPLLQLDQPLVHQFKKEGFIISIETNGTILPPDGIDWICVSPKFGAEFVLQSGDELKLIFPQGDMNPNDYEDLPFKHFYIQPMDSPMLEDHILTSLQYCLDHPKWKLSIQIQKVLGIE